MSIMPSKKNKYESDDSDDGAVSAKNIIAQRTPRSAKKVALGSLKTKTDPEDKDIEDLESSGSEYEVDDDDVDVTGSEALCESEGIGGEQLFKFKPEKNVVGKMQMKAKEATDGTKAGHSPRTPRRQRKKLHQKVAKMMLSETHSSSESSEEESEESEDDEIQINPRRIPRTPSSSVKISEGADEYFMSKKRAGTSDHTLSRLETPRLEQRQMLQLLGGSQSNHKQEMKELLHEAEACFHEWKLLLRENFNLLLYGVGSKFDIMQRFRELQLRNSTCVVVNGFFPGITIRQILGSICEALEDCRKFPSSGDDLERIVEYLNRNDAEEVFLLVHNIDGVMLRSCQSTLGRLASLPHLHLIASIDHINAPLLWDGERLSEFRWVWWEVSTFKRYMEETSWEGSLLVQQQSGLALASLHHVFSSLNPNAQGIFMVIVNEQLDNYDDPTFIGLSFAQLYSKCREAFLVNSDLTLRAQLTEFRDHRLIKSKQGVDKAEHLYCPVEVATLKEFIINNKDAM